MTAKDVLVQLKALGSEQTKKTLLRHGAREPFFGVKVADLKTLQKKIKTDHALALDLYASGNSDAMYLAGLIADPAAKALGVIEVDMGDTSCRVPDAGASIAKIEKAGRVGKKRKHAMC